MSPVSDQLQQCLTSMSLIRATELKLLELYSRGLLNGTVHTCVGQEACAVGVISNLNPSIDTVFTNHRGHGHYVAFTKDVKGLIAEVMGKKDGVCKGIGGSQHLHQKHFYSNGIQGAGMPIIAGMAFAKKMRKSEGIGVAFIGDGTFGEGILYETLNLASLWRLPLLVVVEHNKYAQSTPTHTQHAGDFSLRARSFDIATAVEDGMDLVKIKRLAEKMIEEVRLTSTPRMIILDTYRFTPHSKGDDFRDPAEIESYRKRDPFVLLDDVLGKGTVDEAKTEAVAQVDAIVDELLESESCEP